MSNIIYVNNLVHAYLDDVITKRRFKQFVNQLSPAKRKEALAFIQEMRENVAQDFLKLDDMLENK